MCISKLKIYLHLYVCVCACSHIYNEKLLNILLSRVGFQISRVLTSLFSDYEIFHYIYIYIIFMKTVDVIKWRLSLVKIEKM